MTLSEVSARVGRGSRRAGGKLVGVTHLMTDANCTHTAPTVLTPQILRPEEEAAMKLCLGAVAVQLGVSVASGEPGGGG